MLDESSEVETVGEGSAASESQDSWFRGASSFEMESEEPGYPGAPVSTMIVDEAVEPVRDIGVCEEDELVSEAVEDLRSGRPS